MSSDVQPREENKPGNEHTFRRLSHQSKRQKHVKDISFYFPLSIFFHQIVLLNHTNVF